MVASGRGATPQTATTTTAWPGQAHHDIPSIFLCRPNAGTSPSSAAETTRIESVVGPRSPVGKIGAPSIDGTPVLSWSCMPCNCVPEGQTMATARQILFSWCCRRNCRGGGMSLVLDSRDCARLVCNDYALRYLLYPRVVPSCTHAF